MELIIAISIGLLFGAAIFLLLRRNIIRSAIGLVVLSNAINLFLIAAGRTWGEAPAYVNGQEVVRSDALPQAMVLTAIVISMGGLAFMLSTLYIISSRYKTSDQDEVKNLKY